MTSNSLFVNYHIGHNSCPKNTCFPAVYYRPVNSSNPSSFDDLSESSMSVSVMLDYKAYEKRANRQVYSSALTNLQADTLYEFKIVYLSN
jgi:hypothetical protein